MGFKNMAAMSRPVGLPYHDVRMKLRFFATQRYIAHQRKNLHLLIHWNSFVVFLRALEKAEHGVVECSDGREMARLQAALLGESSKTLDEFIALFEYQHKRFLRAAVNQFALHEDLPREPSA